MANDNPGPDDQENCSEGLFQVELHPSEAEDSEVVEQECGDQLCRDGKGHCGSGSDSRYGKDCCRDEKCAKLATQ